MDLNEEIEDAISCAETFGVWGPSGLVAAREHLDDAVEELYCV